MNNKTVLIVQARMGSTRLPGKSLMKLAGEPLIGRLLERVKRCNMIDEIVLAIPNTVSNNPLETLAKKYDVSLYRGSENDLVDRYYCAAKQYCANLICRLPGDNPVPEPSEIDRMVEAHIKKDNNFSSNLSEMFNNGYPDGIGVEVIDFFSLEKVWKTHVNEEMREHVHLNFFNYSEQRIVDSRFQVGTVECPESFRRPDLNLDVNTIEQYEFISELYEYLYPRNPEFHIIDIIRWYDDVYMKRNFSKLTRRNNEFSY